MKTRTLSYTFIALIITNNLLWLLGSRSEADFAGHPASNSNEPLNAACASIPPGYVKGASTHKAVTDIGTTASPDGAGQGATSRTAARVETAATPLQPLSPGAEASTLDVPQETSQNYLYQRQYKRDYYYATGRQERLDTIQSLAAQGKDLSLIKEIMQTEEAESLRAAAVSKLAYQHSYAATGLLVDALDDPAEEVRLTALNAIVTNGDRTLIPLLREKLESLPDGSVRTEMAQSIHRLEYSVTMQMDGLPTE
jgi:hypothetical protein